MLYIGILFIFITACSSERIIADPGLDVQSPDATILMDAQILEKLSPDTGNGGYWDSAAMPDSSTDAVANDNGSQFPDTVTMADTGEIQPEDAVTYNDTAVEDTSLPCGGSCGDGYTCKHGECVFAAQCDTKGLMDLNSINMMMAGEFIKLKGLITIAKPSCSNKKCDSENPCCQDCYANMKLGPLTLKGDGISIGCLGTNCDYKEKCTSLSPDQIYIVWGTLSVSGFELELQVQGFCVAK